MKQVFISVLASSFLSFPVLTSKVSAQVVPQWATNSNFQESLTVVLEAEGGCQNNPYDPGNVAGSWTCRGVTQETYNQFFPGDVRWMTDDQLLQIYYQGYWVKIDGDRLHPIVALVLFDIAVNSGYKLALRWHRQFVQNSRLRQDPYALSLALLERRRQFYLRLPNPRFQRGWLNRNDRLVQYVKNTQDSTTPIVEAVRLN